MPFFQAARSAAEEAEAIKMTAAAKEAAAAAKEAAAAATEQAAAAKVTAAAKQVEAAKRTAAAAAAEAKAAKSAADAELTAVSDIFAERQARHMERAAAEPRELEDRVAALETENQSLKRRLSAMIEQARTAGMKLNALRGEVSSRCQSRPF